MRSSLACKRASKVKCVNDGQSPCRGCLKSDNSETCVLSRPPKKAGVRNPRELGPRSEPAGRRETRDDVNRLSRSINANEHRPACPSEISNSSLAALPDSPSKVRHLYEKCPSSIWSRAIIVFRTHFPEYGYNHPEELELPSDVISDHQRLKLMALLAVTVRYFRGEVPDDILEQHHFVVAELQHCLTDPPSLALIQAYQLMALYEWGEGHMHSAWIYVGVAMRMLQSLLATKNQTHTNPPRTSQITEVECRTYWSCVSLEKQVSTGRGRPALSSLRDPIPPFPTSDDEFLFGPISAPANVAHTLTHHGVVDYALLRNLELQKPVFIRMLALGMNIWSKIHQWVALGGRKQPGMVDVDNSPWRPTSQWAMMRNELEMWRHANHPRHRYPETPIMAHVYLHQAVPVVHLNLVYYLSIIWLNREFMPFLPIQETIYRGPLDAPVFNEEAPAGWWESKAAEHFAAVRCITSLRRAMRHLDPQHHTPFSGLCIFTATLMNLYAAKFPAMSRTSSSFSSQEETPEALFSENMEDLQRFGELWKMGRGLLDVVGVMRKLYDRVLNDDVRRTNHSRDSYAVLERTINLAQDHEIEVSQLAAEASSGDGACHDDFREVENASQDPAADVRQYPDGDTSYFSEGDSAEISGVRPMSPGSLSAVLDEDVWRDFVFFQDM